jgi:hypothetical protein
MRMPKVQGWHQISEERVAVNKKWESGFIKRFFVDPKQKLGLGSTVSAFYKDGSELLLTVHWSVGTKNAYERSVGPNGKWGNIEGPKKLLYPFSIEKEFLASNPKRTDMETISVFRNVNTPPFLSISFNQPTASKKNLKTP